jgi:putative ABC transport system permease protein
MKILQAIKLSFSAIRSHKLRSFLTMLGVIIGVFSVVTLVSIAQGATGAVTEQIEEMGPNLIIVNITGRGVNRTLSLEEVKRLSRREGVIAVAPVVSGRVTVKHGNITLDTSLEGTSPEYRTVRNQPEKSGRFLTEADLQFRQNVALLGSSVAEELFPLGNPLGREIRINGTPFTVIGLLEEQGAGLGGSGDDKIIIPLTTAQRLLRTSGIGTIYLQASAPDAVDRVISGVEAALTLHFRDDQAFTLFDQAQILDTMEQITGTLTLMLGGIAGISLLVGGIGIMNIMLVSVTERTREIGICKALGAKKRDILLQFLIESAVLSGFGGLLGLALGYGAGIAISSFTDLTPAFSPLVVVVALVFSLCVGLFFGLWPANKAAKLNPIEALRAQ